MNQLLLQIHQLLQQDMSFGEIANALDIPVSFVVEASELTYQPQDCCPFATVNS